jgi:hypothetical protein
MGRKEGFNARKVVHSDPNKTERKTLKKSASHPLHQVVKTTKHPSDSFSQQNEAEEATEEEEEGEEDVATARSGKTTTMRQKTRREVATRGASEALSVADGRSGRRGGGLVPRAAEEQEQESTAATHSSSSSSSLCTSPLFLPLITDLKRKLTYHTLRLITTSSSFSFSYYY